MFNLIIDGVVDFLTTSVMICLIASIIAELAINLELVKIPQSSQKKNNTFISSRITSVTDPDEDFLPLGLIRHDHLTPEEMEQLCLSN
jgi:hypothetical protein